MNTLTKAGATLGAVVCVLMLTGSAFGQAQGMTLQQGLNTAKGQLNTGAAEGANNAANGVLLMGRPEMKNGVGLFGYYFYLEGRLWEIEVKGPGPKGTVVTAKVTDPSSDNVKEEDVKNILATVQKYSGTKLPMNRYLEIAKQMTGGEPTSVKLTTQGGKLVMDVTVGGKVVSIDLATGKALGKG